MGERDQPGLTAHRAYRSRRSTLQVSWRSLVDGKHGWGSFTVTGAFCGHRRYCLTVLPPDISSAQRRMWRLWRLWPRWSALVWLCALLCVSGAAGSPVTVLTMCAGLYFGAGAILFAQTERTRASVATVSFTLPPGQPNGDLARCHGAWQKMIRVMLAAEDMLRRGTVSPVEYEAVWWEVYRRTEAAAAQQ